MMKNNSINLEQKINIADEKALQFIEEVTTNADQVQKQVLSEILTANANVEYLQRYGLHGHTDHETFKKVIPLIEYEDIQSDINRIGNGDTSPILCQQPISEFFPSSGTSGGESRLIPKTQEDIEKGRSIFKFLMPIVNRHVPGLDKGKVMQFMFVKHEFKTPGGILTRAATTVFFKSLMSKDSCLFNPNNHYTSPYETIVCEDSYQSMYSQLLCGLLQKNQVLRLGCAFASTFIQVIRFLENNWKLLCNDIRTGTIDTQITDPYVRESVLKILGPAPKLADVIESECVKDSWEGVISRLWPNAKYIDTVVTGNMSQYIPILDYYSNGLPIVTLLYASSECLFGLNLNPLCKPNEISYTMIPTMAYFEFLPIDRNNYPHGQKPQRQQELVDLVDVKLGQEYELVITTYAGLSVIELEMWYD